MGKLKRRAKVKIQARKVLESTLPEDRTSEQIDAVVSLTNRSTYFWNMETVAWPRSNKKNKNL